MSQINLFISYSHEDESYFRKLKSYINARSCPNLNIWDDGEIRPGNEWDTEIKTKLNDAQIILLLISQDFLNSNYIDAIELKTALERHAKKQCKVIPIFTKNCYLENYPQITKLQGLPTGMKFLSDLGEQVYAQYAEIQKEIIEVAADMLTDKNILDSIHKNDDKSTDAKAIEGMRNSGKIFLSVPSSEEGKKKRRSFIIQVEGKIKYENWPYEIVPGLNDGEALSKETDEEIVKVCAGLIDDSIYSIHIISNEADLASGIDKMQYDLSRSIHADSPFHKRIVWLLTADLKSKLNKEVSMDPLFTGNDFESMFDLIKSLDVEKDKKITEMKKGFSPNKKVFMFYDFFKDHNSELRIRLKTSIEENENIAVFPSVPNSTLTAEKEELAKCDGAFIFYGASDPEWFLMRQSLLIAEGEARLKGLCVDEPGIKLKIDRDVSKNAFVTTIKGINGFDDDLKSFLDKLKL